MRRGISLQAELARLGFRWFVKRRSHHQTIGQARQSFHRYEAIVPKPPRTTLTARVDAAGVPADLVVTPVSLPDRHLLFLHGGGYRLGSPATYRHFTWRLAAATESRVLVPDYRLAPAHPFPAAVEDAFAAYGWLLRSGADPRHLIVAGDSAGGGLALALLLKLRDLKIALPAAAVALSPWTDLALTGESFRLNAASDPVLNADDVPKFSSEYLAGADPQDPYASPLYGDLSSLPPTLLQVGSDEILLDDAVRFARKMEATGCHVELQVWQRMPHDWHLLAPVLPEARRAIAAIGKFVDQRRDFARAGPP